MGAAGDNERITIREVAVALSKCIMEFSGYKSGVKIRSCPRTADIDEGHLIIRCVAETHGAPAESSWYHVSHCYWAPRVQPTFMRLRLQELSNGIATLEPMQEPGKRLRTYWWQDLVGVARSISAEAPSAQAIAIEYWKVREEGHGRALRLSTGNPSRAMALLRTGHRMASRDGASGAGR